MCFLNEWKWTARRGADVLTEMADMIEEVVLRQAGLDFVERDPGFPGWRINGRGYFNTPREAMESVEAKR
jgi:hypothetical protein